MRTFLKPLLRTALCGLLAFPISLPCAHAKDKTKDKPVLTEQTVKLDPFEVKANPFAHWGIGISAWIDTLDRLFGAPPKKMYVSFVAKDSPANLVGVQLGDQIIAVDGFATNTLRWNELKKRFNYTEIGSVVELTLFDNGKRISRSVKLEIRSNKSWVQNQSGFDADCWGLLVSSISSVPAKPMPLHMRVSPKMLRIKEYRTLPVVKFRKTNTEHGEVYRAEPVYAEDGKAKMEEKRPLYITRRTLTISWAETKLTLIEREKRVVEVIESGEAPEMDDVLGRLMQEGSTLTLRADGTYELKDAPPKTEPATPLPAATPDLPAGAPPTLPPPPSRTPQPPSHEPP